MDHPINEISKALFENDPMHTSCKENNCFDEYDRIGKEVELRIRGGESLESALMETINYYFFDGEEPELSNASIKSTVSYLRGKITYD